MSLHARNKITNYSNEMSSRIVITSTGYSDVLDTTKYEPLKCWYIKKGLFTKKYGYTITDSNHTKCRLEIPNEFGNTIIVDDIPYYNAYNSLIIFAFDKENNSYYELFNESSKINPININKLENMVMIIQNEYGMYVINKNNKDYYENAIFSKLSNDGKSINAKIFADGIRNREISYEDYPVSGEGIIIKTNRDSSFMNINDEFKIQFSLNKSLPSQIAAKYFDNYDLELLENEFEDDDTLNYQFNYKYLSDEQFGEIDFFKNKLPKYSIYGLEVSLILDAVQNNCSFQDSWFETEDERNKTRESCVKIFEKIKEKYNLNENDAAQYLYDKYVSNNYYIGKSINHFLAINRIDYKRFGEIWKNKYNQIHMELIDQGILNIKWKSETQLFKIVKSLYPDTIYQYRDSWLGLQSLDIYIPSLKIGIEYQGKQHYEPIDIFGGEEHFNKQQKLDNKKRNLCINNSVKLIEWKYDCPITKLNVKNEISVILEER